MYLCISLCIYFCFLSFYIWRKTTLDLNFRRRKKKRKKKRGEMMRRKEVKQLQQMTFPNLSRNTGKGHGLLDHKSWCHSSVSTSEIIAGLPHFVWQVLAKHINLLHICLNWVNYFYVIYSLIIYVTFWILSGNLFVLELLTNVITTITGLMEILFFLFSTCFLSLHSFFLSFLKVTKHFII